MSEVLTEILKADPSFDKDSFLKLCEKDIIPNVLEVSWTENNPCRPKCSLSMYSWMYYVITGVICHWCRRWSEGSWRCWRTGVTRRYDIPHSLTHSFQTHTQALTLCLILVCCCVDVQSAGSPHTASKSPGSSVPLKNPGHWQYWRKLLDTYTNNKIKRSDIIKTFSVAGNLVKITKKKVRCS